MKCPQSLDPIRNLPASECTQTYVMFCQLSGKCRHSTSKSSKGRRKCFWYQNYRLNRWSCPIHWSWPNVQVSKGHQIWFIRGWCRERPSRGRRWFLPVGGRDCSWWSECTWSSRKCFQFCIILTVLDWLPSSMFGKGTVNHNSASSPRHSSFVLSPSPDTTNLLPFLFTFSIMIFSISCRRYFDRILTLNLLICLALFSNKSTKAQINIERIWCSSLSKRWGRISWSIKDHKSLRLAIEAQKF